MNTSPAFVHRLAYFDKATALIEENGRVWRYADLAEAVDSFAENLGTKRKLVLIETLNQVEPLIAYLACLKAGHPVILMPHGAVEKDNRIETTFQPNLIYRQDNTGWALTECHADTYQLHPDLRVLLTTSGSTGTPKLVKLSGENLQANAESITEYLDISTLDRAITSLPFNYSYGLSVINSHLVAGASISLTDRSVASQCFWDQLKDQECTSLAGVPYTYDLMERAGFAEMDLPSLRTLTQAGGKMPAEKVRYHARLAARRGRRFHVMYGQTEATARMAWLPPNLAAKYADYIGQAIPGGTFTLKDENGKTITRHGKEGELIYSGPNFMMGYAERIEDLSNADDCSSLNTGDLAIRNRKGLYRITGRKSRFCKLYGLRFNLDDIENCLKAKGINCAVSGDDAFISVCITDADRQDEVEKHLRRRYTLKRGDIIVWTTEEIPLLNNGKVNYPQILSTGRDLRLKESQQHIRRSDLQSDYAAALGMADIPRNASFASLQGDSLSYVQASVAIEKHLGYLPKGWEDMAISDLQLMRKQTCTTTAVDTDIALKAAAILMVVAHHAGLISFSGGALTLLMIAGFNTARFQMTQLMAGNTMSVIAGIMKRIILPYFIILLLYLSWRQDFHLPTLTLTGNLFGSYGERSTFLTPYWFLEVYFQIMLMVCALFMIPRVRSMAGSHPFMIALFMLAFSTLFPIVSIIAAGVTQRLPHLLFHVFAFGWAVASAKTPNQKLLLMVFALIAFPLILGPTNAQGWLVAAASTVLIWFPRLSVSKQLKAPIVITGAASFYIYLLHNIPVHYLRYEAPLDAPVITGTLALLLAVMLGVCADLARQHLPAMWKKIRLQGPLPAKYHGSSSVSQ